MEIEGERERDKLKIFRVLLLDVAVAVDDDDAVSVRLLSFPRHRARVCPPRLGLRRRRRS